MAEQFDVAIVGAGASGLMCAAVAAECGKQVIVLDNGSKPGRKILMAGGGKCNFTNRRVGAENFICSNPHFVKSALTRFGSREFIAMVEAAGIAFHERDHGQLFCDESSARILDLLVNNCRRAGAKIVTDSQVSAVGKDRDTGIFLLKSGSRKIETPSLVIATGGVSIPASGATPFGYQVAEQFGIPVVKPRPGLVPFTLSPEDKALFQPLSGLSLSARVACRKTAFEEQLLFTHRGLSGPVILQASSYWHPGDTLTIDFLPGSDLDSLLENARKSQPRKEARSLVRELLPRRLADACVQDIHGRCQPVASLSRDSQRQMVAAVHHRQIKPAGTEGNRTAEVTVGGVDCRCVSSKTFECREVPGLFFIGEVLDVTGQLGGYNLQWAWSSGFCAGHWV